MRLGLVARSRLGLVVGGGDARRGNRLGDGGDRARNGGDRNMRGLGVCRRDGDRAVPEKKVEAVLRKAA